MITNFKKKVVDGWRWYRIFIKVIHLSKKKFFFLLFWETSLFSVKNTVVKWVSFSRLHHKLVHVNLSCNKIVYLCKKKQVKKQVHTSCVAWRCFYRFRLLRRLPVRSLRTSASDTTPENIYSSSYHIFQFYFTVCRYNINQLWSSYFKVPKTNSSNPFAYLYSNCITFNNQVHFCHIITRLKHTFGYNHDMT